MKEFQSSASRTKLIMHFIPSTNVLGYSQSSRFPGLCWRCYP